MDQEIKTVIQYPTGSTEFDIPFDYLSRKFVRVSLVSDDNRRLLSNITEYRYVSKTRVKLLVATTGFDRVEIRRFTSASERVVDFSDGSVLRANDLNVSQLQSAHIAEEARDAALLAMPQDDAGNLDARNRRIVRLAPGIDGTDAVNKNQLDETLGEAGGILSSIKDTQKEVVDFIEEFANDTGVVRGVRVVYNNGSANGGETSFVINKEGPVLAVPLLEINGSTQTEGWHYDYTPSTKTVRLVKPLEAGDFVVAQVASSVTDVETALRGPNGASMIGMPQGGSLKQAVTWRSILSFGAVGDGSTDDTAAFQAAWEAPDVYIMIPTGYRFVVTAPVGSLTVGKAKRWCGERGSVIITKGLGGFHQTGLGWGFEGIRFVPLAVAPMATVPFAIKSGTVDNNRYSSIVSCEFRGYTSGQRYDVAVDLYNVWYSKIENLYINQSGEGDFSKQSFGGIGLRMSYCVNNNITNCQIGSCTTGMLVTANTRPVPAGGTTHCCEGLIIHANTMIANKCNLDVREGYFIKVTNNVIDIPLSSTVNPVYFAAMSSQLTDNWISTATGTIYIGRGESGLQAYDGSMNVISRNTIRSSSSATHDNIRVGAGVGLLNIIGNTITFGGTGISADGRSSGWYMSDNIFAAQSIQAYDVHLVTSMRVGTNKVYSAGKPTKSVHSSTVLTPTTFSAFATADLVDGAMGENKITGPQQFNIAVPEGYFVGAPEFAIANLASGRILGVARYLRSESSATSLRFSFVSIGGPIVAGNYAFSVMASDRASSF